MNWKHSRDVSQRFRALLSWRMIGGCTGAALMAASLVSCGPQPDALRLVVEIPSTSMSKLPFVIARDQGLYAKHGLDVDLRLPADEGKVRKLWLRAIRKLTGTQTVDMRIDGHGPAIVLFSRGQPAPWRVSLASTDCSVRYYVIARPGINRLDDLAGRRLGVGLDYSTAGFAALRLVDRMGWVRDRDITVVPSTGFKELQGGTVDAIVGGDETIESAEEAGYKVLLDTREWNEELTGNSVLVAPGWLDEGTHREAARRFLKSVVEAVALFHERPEIALDVLGRWQGTTDRAQGKKRYARSDYVPRKPFPCGQGVRATMDLYDSDAMRKYAPEDFYDDSLMRELDQTGFIDGVYTRLSTSVEPTR
jgi:NitT/TauT family transport system substrate-binding protein